MSSRLLILVSLVFAGFAAYLYLHQERIEQVKSNSIERYDYWANDISAVQTNEMGQAAFNLSAKRLVHDPKTDILVLEKLKANMKQVGSEDATFHFESSQASWHQPSFALTLSGGVVVTRQLSNVSTDSMGFGNIRFTTELLQANTKTKILTGSQPIKMTMNNSSVEADAMRADLNRGEYEFEKLRAHYVQ